MNRVKLLEAEHTDHQDLFVHTLSLYTVNPETLEHVVLQQVDFGPLPLVIPSHQTVGVSLIATRAEA